MVVPQRLSLDAPERYGPWSAIVSLIVVLFLSPHIAPLILPRKFVRRRPILTYGRRTHAVRTCCGLPSVLDHIGRVECDIAEEVELVADKL